jgi:MoaA/NifB/PqqE/SkfB family radical SAM enzyme
VAAEETPTIKKMELAKAKEIIRDMALAGVTGISFTAGEPFIYYDDLLELVGLCREKNMYTRIVTNSFWAKTPKKAEQLLGSLKECGLSQLRLSYSRWHQQHIPRHNVLHAAQGCMQAGIDYFVSFVTDFSEEDDAYEDYLRKHTLKFFPEPVIYAGRADTLARKVLFTDYQENRCAMNPYLAPDLSMYACCDAGSHFNATNFFLLGNLQDHSIDELFSKNETHPLYKCIRSLGITAIASFAGMMARDIVTYRKCELCKRLFDSPETLKFLQDAGGSKLGKWLR